MSWLLIIIGIAVGLNVVAIVAELLMHDREKMKDLKVKMKEKQNKIKELSKKKDPASLKEMTNVQKELFSLTGQQMKMGFRSMLITFPIFILVFWWLSSQDFKGVSFPIIDSWYWFYIISYFIIAMVMTPLKNQIMWGHWRGATYTDKGKAKNG